MAARKRDRESVWVVQRYTPRYGEPGSVSVFATREAAYRSAAERLLSGRRSYWLQTTDARREEVLSCEPPVASWWKRVLHLHHQWQKFYKHLLLQDCQHFLKKIY